MRAAIDDSSVTRGHIDDGRLAEERVQHDERVWLRQLGVEQP